jgi:hypothetical protein
MTNTILEQLSRSTLLPSSLSAAILAGNTPPLEEIVTQLLIAEMDCEGLTASDPKSSWTERRIARQVLVLAFLLAIVSINHPSLTA